MPSGHRFTQRKDIGPRLFHRISIYVFDVVECPGKRSSLPFYPVQKFSKIERGECQLSLGKGLMFGLVG